jgi:hypothetical protein
MLAVGGMAAVVVGLYAQPGLGLLRLALAVVD